MTCRTAVAAAEPPDEGNTPPAITVVNGSSAASSYTVATVPGPGILTAAPSNGTVVVYCGTAGQPNGAAPPVTR